MQVFLNIPTAFKAHCFIPKHKTAICWWSQKLPKIDIFLSKKRGWMIWSLHFFCPSVQKYTKIKSVYSPCLFVPIGVESFGKVGNRPPLPTTQTSTAVIKWPMQMQKRLCKVNLLFIYSFIYLGKTQDCLMPFELVRVDSISLHQVENT